MQLIISLLSGDILWTKFTLHHADVSNMKLETSEGYNNKGDNIEMLFQPSLFLLFSKTATPLYMGRRV